MAAAEGSAPKPPVAAWGEVVFCGGTNWAMLGRMVKKGAKAEDDDAYPNLCTPHRLRPLIGVRVTQIAAGSSATHCAVITEAGQLMTWGRNEFGQLGHGDLSQRNAPTTVTGLDRIALRASCGKFHTAVVVDGGEGRAFGANKYGQLGTGQVNRKRPEDDLSLVPARVALPGPCTSVACGAEFTAWLSESGAVLTCGLPEHGQLGDGSDHQYNTKDSSIKMAFEPRPTPSAVGGELAGKTAVRVTCGNAHTAVITANPDALYTWGCGDYGRLGHKEQKDEFRPRRVETFRNANQPTVASVLACGAMTTSASAMGEQLYCWGKVKATGDAIMYPQPLAGLMGWHLRDFSAGPTGAAACAETSAITWGSGANGENGYGVTGPKSSVQAKKVNALEGMTTLKVACGAGFNLFLIAAPGPGGPSIETLPVFDPPAEKIEPVEDGEGAGGAKKAKADDAAPAKGKGKKKA